MRSNLRQSLAVLEEAVSDIGGRESVIQGYDKLDWMREYLVIEDKDTGKIISAANYHDEQLDLLKTIIEMEIAGIPPRIIVLKARQIGMSTAAEDYIFASAWLASGQNNIVVSHVKSSGEYLFDICTMLYDNLPLEMQKPLDYRTKGLLRFSNPHRSAIRVGTAEDKELFSSQRVHRAHLSEFAKWSSPKKPYVAVMQCVPNISQSLVLIEFTAVDTGVMAQQMWDAANSEEGSDYRPIFYSWKNHKRYTIPLATNEKLILTPQEFQHQQRHNLSDSQAKWMVRVKKNQCHNDMQLFQQEYPATPQEAWIAQGQSYFNVAVLNDMLHKKTGTVMEPIFRGLLRWETEGSEIVIPEEDLEGILQIWKYPEPNRYYVIGADISEGVGQDWTVVQVWLAPQNPGDIPEQVAKLRSNSIDTDDAALQIFMLGFLYNTALVGVERNGPGLSVLGFLERGLSGYPQTSEGYPNLYYHTITDKTIVEHTNRLGWLTGPTSKKIMLAGLKSRINKNELILRSKTTIYELRGFGYDFEKRKYIQTYENPITKKANDDEVDSSGVTDEMLEYYLTHRFFRKLSTWS